MYAFERSILYLRTLTLKLAFSIRHICCELVKIHIAVQEPIDSRMGIAVQNDF